MVQFGKKIITFQHEPWSPHYLAYGELKSILQKEKDQDNLQEELLLEEDEESENLSSFWQQTHSAEFLKCLHLQLEKILLFVLQEQGRIAIELAECRNSMWQVRTPQHVDDLIHRYRETAMHLLRLVQFLDLNVTGIRKIIKKHDKCLDGAKLSSVFWVSKRSRHRHRLAHSRLAEPLLLQDQSLGALAAVLETGLQELRRVTKNEDDKAVWSQPQTTRKKEHVRHNSTPATVARFRAIPLAQDPENIPADKDHLLGSHSEHEEVTSLASHTALGVASIDMIMLRIQAARDQLQETNSFVHLLAAPLLVDGADTPEPEEAADDINFDEREPPPPPGSFISNQLNLLSTFLYMTNYYIVAPTSGSYAAKLGGDPALAAMIIGMTPIAALVSTVLFSWWTNHSYKAAILFASCCSLLGNFCYAMGLPRNSLTWVMVGRLLNGFGSARSINRRYIADTFSRRDRTAASAAFVTAGALGMAAGPAIASFLHFVTPGPNNALSLYWQVENSPGWFMMGLWTLYLVMTALYFRDPPKRKMPAVQSTAVVEMTVGEQKPLLSTTAKTVSSESLASETSVVQSLFLNVPVMITFFIYFVLKLVLEAVLSSCSMLTSFYFDWDPSVAGFYLAGLGLLMLPANVVVSLLARRFDDRELIVALQVVMLASCLGILKMSDQYSVPQYIIASLVAFISTNALEGPNMSLLSKTIPSRWSQGIINVGLLATEAGTAGRAVGDVLLSAFGSNGLEYLLNRTFGTFAVLSSLTLATSVWFFEHLEPIDKDD